MILLLVFAAALGVGLLRGGSLRRVASLPLRWPGISLLAFAAQIVVICFPGSRHQGLLSLRTGLLLISYLALLLMLWANRRIPGGALLGLGLVLNLLVMLANGGYMPITPQAMQQIGHRHVETFQPGSRVPASKDVALPKEQTRLWVLSDILVLPRPFPIPSAFSVGDVLVSVGAFLIVQRALLGLPLTGTAGAQYAAGLPARRTFGAPEVRRRWGRTAFRPTGGSSVGANPLHPVCVSSERHSSPDQPRLSDPTGPVFCPSGIPLAGPPLTTLHRRAAAGGSAAPLSCQSSAAQEREEDRGR